MPDERVTGADQRLNRGVRVGADRDIEDPRGIELKVLALRDEAGTGRLDRIGIEHQVSVTGERAAQLLSSQHSRRPHERLEWGDGDLEVHRDHLDSIM